MAARTMNEWGAWVARALASPYQIAFAYILGLIPVMVAGSDGGWILFGYIAPFFLFAAVVLISVHAFLIRLFVGRLRGVVGRLKSDRRRPAAPVFLRRADPLWDRWVDG